MLKGRIKSRIFSIAISCWGLILFGAFLAAEILDAGSFTVFLQRFTQPSLVFLHSLLFLSVPGFIVIGCFYQKLANSRERLEQMVDERMRVFRESEEIRMAEDTFRNIFESANDALIFLNRSGRILDVNQKTVEMFGGSREELLGKHFTRVGIFSLKDISTLMRNFTNILEGKKVSIDLTFKNKKREEKSLECSISRIKRDGKTSTIMVVAKDITKRKKAEEELRSSEERLNILFQYAPDAYYLNDLKGNLVDGNKAAEELTGFQKSELIGKSFLKLDLLPRSQIPKAAKLLAMNAFGKPTGPDEFVLNRKDGVHVQVEIRTFPVKIKNQTVILGIARDITERKKAEQAVRASLERYRSFIEVTGEMGWTTNAGGEVVEDIPSFRNFTGQTYEEITGWGWLKALHPDDLERTARVWKEATRTRSKYEVEYRVRRHDGVYRYFLARGVPVLEEDGSIREWVGTCIDITERKMAEEELEESEKRFKSIFEGARDGILAADAKTKKFVLANPRILEITGYSEEELLRLGVEDIHPKKDLPYVIDAFAKQLQRKIEIARDMPVLRKDRNVIYCDINSYLLEIGERKLLVGLFRDVTERKNMEEQLKEYSERLEEKVEERTNQLKEAQEQLLKSERLAAIGQLAAMIGHDLRNPLAGISTCAYYLKKKLGSKMDEKAREMFELIEKDIEHSNKIINDLLDYAREIRLELTETTPKLVMKEAFSLVEIPEMIQVLDETQNEPKIKVDVEKMKRVLVNLVKNAVDAMPIGGKLVIESKKLANNVEIAITDTGTGIPNDVLEKLWMPLFTTKAKGMGLGLPICKRFVEAHGGSISVESAVGKGTTFRVSFPIELKLEGGEKVWVKPPESLLLTTMKA